jgi:hypothetical protein
MMQEQARTLVMVAHIRHDSDRRLRQAYRLLWQSIIANEESVERKELNHASSSVVRPSLHTASGTGGDHRESD